MAVAVAQRVARLNSRCVQGAAGGRWAWALAARPRCSGPPREEQQHDSTTRSREQEQQQEEAAAAAAAAAGGAREAVLQAALAFVPQLGWSREALAAGARAAGLPGAAHGLLPAGGADLVHFFAAACDRRLRERLRALPPPPAHAAARARFAQEAVRARLQMLRPVAAQWPQALALMARPQHAPRALARLLATADDVCYHAGDRAVDFSWYTHRVTLAGIYKATELYLIQDKSDNYEATWNFLAKCIEESVSMHTYLQQSKEASQMAQDTITAAFVTARNILGLNSRR